MAWQNPKTDWETNPKSPTAVDFNRIEGNTAFLLTEIETKKGLLVDAINAKQNLVTVESSYQEMADGINVINQNPRVANGIGVLTKVNDWEYKLVVTGLAFKPSKVFLKGKMEVRINDNANQSGTFENWVEYDYAIVNEVLAPNIIRNLVINYQFITISSTTLICSISYQSNGFTVIIKHPEQTDQRQIRNYTGTTGNQYWFAQE